ncbi:MAG TPA: hypothetical protein VEA16_08965, partial [Vicinamibacterales bacterium]|nr:hypothetical protein [Vicinamibacterales bacterium]
ITLGGFGSNRAVGEATSANFGVMLSGTVTSTTGNIVVRGAGNTGASGNGHGIRIFNTSSASSSGGSITMDGLGGNAGAGISSNGNISAGGNITLTGVGGNSATGTFQHGVTVANATVQSSGGSIVISGNGGGGINGAAGVQLSNSTVQISSNGNIQIYGNAGSTTSGTTSGISIVSNSVVQSSGTTGLIELRGNGGVSSTGTTHGVQLNASVVQSNGSITVVGYGGNSAGASSNGISFTDGASIRTALAGNISLTGTGGTSASAGNAGGLSLTDDSYVRASGTGDIVVVGTGNAASGTGSARGVSLRPNSSSNGASILAASGNITITGTGGTTGTGTEAIHLQGANTTIGGGSGSITLIGDAMNLGSAPGVAISTTGLTTVRPQTSTRVIQLGAGANETATLGLSDAEVGVFTGNNVVIGGSLQAGNIAVVGTAPFSNMGAGGTLTLSAANASSTTGHISLGNAVSTAGNVVVTTAVGNISFTQTGVTAITTGSGKIATVSAGNGAISTSNANTDVDTGVGGNVVLTAKSGIGTIADLIDLSTSNVSANNTTSGDVSIRNTRSLVLGTSGLVVNTAPTGNIQVIVSGTNNDLTVNQTVSVAGGSVILTAGNSVIFDQGTANGVSAAANVTLTAGNHIIGSAATANDVVATRVTMTAGNGIGAANAIETRVSNLAVTNSIGGNVQVSNFAGVNVDTANVVNGNFSLVTGGAVTQSGNVTVTNLASFNAGTSDITLNGAAGNNFGALTFLGGNVAITENSSMTLAGTSNASGTLALTAAGTMNQASGSTIIVAGNATMTANLAGVAQNITFNSATNDFQSATSVAVGNNVTIVDANNFNLGASTISGNANFTALAGNITTAGAVSLGGTTHNFRAEGTGTQGDVIFSHAFTQNNSTTGTFVIEANRSIIFATGASVTGNSGGAGGILHVTLNADRDANSAGAISMVSGTSISSAGGNIVLGGGSNPTQNAAVGVGGDIHGVSLDGATLTAGAGHVSVRGQSLTGTASARGVQLVNNADIVTTTGNVTVVGAGNAGASSTAGVYLADAGTTITTANGAISIAGSHIGTATGGTNRGVWALSGAVVQATEAGTVTISGTGANSAGTLNDGVFVTGTGTKVSTADGTLSIIGTGHGNGGTGIGIHHNGDALITSTGSGAIVLTGTSNATGGANNYGLFVTNGADIVSAGSGNISISGTAGNGTGSDVGVVLDNAGSRISAVSGHIDISGTGNGTGTGAGGLRLTNDFQIETTGSGNIMLTGVGSATGTGIGIDVQSGSDIRASGTGTIRITGTGSNGSSGINLGSGTDVGSASAGDILLRSLGGNIVTSASIQTPAQITFNSVSGVSQTGGNIVGNGNLHILGTGTFSLTSATNNVSLVSANVAGNLAYTDAGSFAIGQITSNSGIALTTTSGINTGSGNVLTLYSPGTVTQTTNNGASAVLTSFMELLGTGGNYQLTNITNNVGTLAANTGTISMADSGALTIGTVNGNSGILATGAVTFNNAALLSINADITANGGLAQNGTGLVTITGPRTITTNGNAVSFATAVTLAGGANTVTIDTTGNGASPNGANLTFTSTVNASTGDTERLTVNTGNAGDVLFNGIVGGTTALGNLAITNAHHLTFNNNVTAAALLQTAGTGNTTVLGNLTTTVGGVSVTTDRIQFNGSVTTPATQDIFLSAQNGVLQAGGAFSTDELLLLGSNNFSISQPGNNVATTVAANITGSLSFRNGANITVGSVTNNSGSATGITTNGGNVTLIALGSVNVSQQINAGAGNVALTANGGSLFGSGTVTAATLTANATGGAVNLPVAAVSAIDVKATSGNITITNTKASVDITSANASGLISISTSNAMVVSGNVVAGAGSNVRLTAGTAGGGGMNIGANITGPAGVTLTVQTDEGILNHTGGTITATNNAIVLQADEMWLQGAANSISSGTANITLRPNQASDQIHLGASGRTTTATANALELSTDELNTLSTANTLVLGGTGQNGSVQVIGSATVTNSANLLVSTTADVNVNSGGNLVYNGSGNVTVSAGNQITGGGVITAANLTLTSVNGIGTTAAPVRLGSTTNLTATNNTSGQIAIQADSGDLTLLGQVTNNGAGGVSLSTVDGSINTGTANLTSGGAVTLVANAQSSTTPRTLTIGTGGLTANGTVTLASADDMQISGNVSSNNNAVYLVAGRSTGLASGVSAIIPVAATEGSTDADGGITLNARVNAGTGAITIYATESVLQPVGNSGSGGLVSGNLTVRTFNDTPGAAIIDLQNNTPSIGNLNSGGVTLETRLANDTSAPAEPTSAGYAASNINYTSIGNLTLTGVGTGADYTAVATTQDINLTALNIQAKNLTLIASAGDVNVNVPITNSQINLGQTGGSLNLLANGNVNINASSSNQGVSIGTRIGTKTDETHVGEPLVQYFDHDLKLVATNNIKI